jgi:hypothetical protein
LLEGFLSGGGVHEKSVEESLAHYC